MNHRNRLLPHLAFLTLLLIAPATFAGDNTKSGIQMKQDDKSEADKGKLNVAVLLYDGALILDFGIAAEMFLAAGNMQKFNVYTVGRKSTVALSILGPTKTDYVFSDAPAPDVIIVPGGPQWTQEAGESKTVEFLQKSHEEGAVLFSICTGGLLLAKAGFLQNKRATTNHQAVNMLRKLSPTTEVADDANYVDDGDIITSAGSGTAMEATLHLIQRLTNAEIASNLARRYLDYPYKW